MNRKGDRTAKQIQHEMLATDFGLHKRAVRGALKHTYIHTNTPALLYMFTLATTNTNNFALSNSPFEFSRETTRRTLSPPNLPLSVPLTFSRLL